MNEKNLALKTNKNIVHTRIIASFVDCVFLGISSLFIVIFFKSDTAWLFPFVLAFLYYIIMETLFGFTLGKYFLKIRVIGNHCGKPKLYQSVIRALFWLFEINPATMLFWVITYMLARNSKFKQRIGDMAAKTYVVYKKDLTEFLENTYENSMNIDEFAVHSQGKKVNLVHDVNGEYRFDSKIQCIEIGNQRFRIKGIENMSIEQISNEINRGARFASFYICLSAVIITKKSLSDIHFIRSGEKDTKYHMPYTIFSILFGWWGFPWGIIWTPSTIISNFHGGVDVTREVLETIQAGVNIKEKERIFKKNQEKFSLNAIDLRSKIEELSNYEFKVEYWNHIDQFSEDVAALIANENERRKSINPNYENYCPVVIDYSMPETMGQRVFAHDYNSSRQKDRKTPVIIGVLIGLALVGLLISSILKSPDYTSMAKDEYESGNYSKAIEYSDDALDNHPNDRDAMLIKGESLYNLGKYEEALYIYKELEKVDSGNKLVYLDLGNVNYYLENYSESLQNFERLIAMDSNYPDGYIGKANVLNKMGKYDIAIKTIDTLLSKEPSNYDAIIVKGTSYLKTEKYKESLVLLDKAIGLKPDNDSAYIGKISILLSQEKYTEGLKLCKEAIGKFKGNEEILWYMADIYSAKEDHKNAVKYYLETVKVNPKNYEAYVSMGWENYYLEDYEKASENAKNALKIYPDLQFAEDLKDEAVEAQKPESERIANFVKNNYLYYDKVNDAESITNTFSKIGEVSIDDIQKYVNKFKYKEDRFTFLISGQYYDEIQTDEKNNHIQFKKVNDHTQYIRIYSFTSSIANEFKEQLNTIKETEKQTLVIDLRDNPGGLAYPANSILDTLLPKCVTSYLVTRDGKINSFNSDENQIKFKHIFIFVNGNSASCSELVSLGLKKYLKNVTIVGTPTVGKGVGQTVFENKKEKYMLFLVSAYWNVKEKNIMGENIKPDIYVKGEKDADYFKVVK